MRKMSGLYEREDTEGAMRVGSGVESRELESRPAPAGAS